MPASITLHGTVKPDGTLELDEKVNLPPGRVAVVVQPMAIDASTRPGVLEVIAEIRRNQQARGHVPRTREEIDAEINESRREADEEMEAVERLYEGLDLRRPNPC